MRIKHSVSLHFSESAESLRGFYMYKSVISYCGQEYSYRYVTVYMCQEYSYR